MTYEQFQSLTKEYGIGPKSTKKLWGEVKPHVKEDSFTADTEKGGKTTLRTQVKLISENPINAMVYFGIDNLKE